MAMGSPGVFWRSAVSTDRRRGMLVSDGERVTVIIHNLADDWNEVAHIVGTIEGSLDDGRPVTLYGCHHAEAQLKGPVLEVDDVRFGPKRNS